MGCPSCGLDRLTKLLARGTGLADRRCPVTVFLSLTRQFDKKISNNQGETRTMNTIKVALFSLALCSTPTFAADCTAPAKPVTPDGATSTMDQMLAGQKAVKTFQAANMEYMSCLDPLLAAAAEQATQGTASEEDAAALKALEEQYNSAVSTEEEVAGDFNTQIRAYKAANPG